MLKQISRHILPERVEYELYSLPTCKLGGRNEVSVAGDENDDVRLTFQRDRGDVESDSHVDALLTQRRSEVLVGQVGDAYETTQKVLLRARSQKQDRSLFLRTSPKRTARLGNP